MFRRFFPSAPSPWFLAFSIAVRALGSVVKDTVPRSMASFGSKAWGCPTLGEITTKHFHVGKIYTYHGNPQRDSGSQSHSRARDRDRCDRDDDGDLDGDRLGGGLVFRLISESLFIADLGDRYGDDGDIDLDGDRLGGGFLFSLLGASTGTDLALGRRSTCPGGGPPCPLPRPRPSLATAAESA